MQQEQVGSEAEAPSQAPSVERKKLWTALAAAAGLLLLLCIFLVVWGLRYARSRAGETPAEPQIITRCDIDQRGICVVSFGADNLNQMVINLQLPRKKYPAFYARVEYRDASLLFSCKRVKEDRSLAYCSGPRSPLGEPIKLMLFSTADDTLLAQGNLMVAAILLPTFPAGTPVSETLGSLEPDLHLTGTPTPSSGIPPRGTPWTPTRSPFLTRTPTPPFGYP